jgi:hypothetical protein
MGRPLQVVGEDPRVLPFIRGNMTFKDYFSQGIRLVKLERDAAEAVASDDGAFGWAVLFFAIGGLLGGLGGSLTSMGFGFFMVLAGPVLHVLGSFVWVGILYLFARMFGGTGDFKGYYSALGIGSLPAWAQVVPFIGWIVSFWTIPVAVIVTERVHKLSTARALFVVLMPIVLATLFVLASIAIVGTAAFLSLMHMSHMDGMGM